MNTAAFSDKKGFYLSVRFASLFAAAHIVLVLLQTNFVPLSGGWNIVWLSFELLLGFGAFMIVLGCLLYALVNHTNSLQSFETFYTDVRSPGMLFLTLWTLWAYAACLMAIREGRATFYHNVRYLFYQTADLLVLFPLGVYFGRRKQTKLLAIVYDSCMALLTAQLLYGFVRFFCGDSKFTAFFGRTFDYSILRAIIGVNSNHTGAYTAFFLVAGIWRFCSLHSRTGKALLAASELVCFTAFVMTESRGAILGMTASIGVWAGAAFWRSGRFSPPVRMICSAFCCVIAASVFLVVYYGSRTAVLSLQNNVLERSYIASQAKVSAVDHPEADPAAADQSGADSDTKSGKDLPGGGNTPYIAPAAGASGDQERRDLIGSGASTLGGRTKIWITVIRGAAGDRHILLHGTSMANTSDWVATVYGKAFRTHNQFLELLVAEGLPALLLFLLWLCWVAGRSISLGLSADAGPEWVLPLSLLLLIVHNMVEMMLVARPHVVCGFFYLIAGYTAGFAPTKKTV